MIWFPLILAAMFISAFAIHTATRALLGKPADSLPGGALACALYMVSVLPQAWWVALPATLLGAGLGHWFSIVCWRNRLGDTRNPALPPAKDP